MDELRRLMKEYFPDEARLEGRDFVPSDTDVVISTASKSGTTWVQQICHGLRSGGNMDFDEISLAIPCLEMAGAYNYGDLQKPQGYLPRMYKTHFWRPTCPKGAGKYIIVARRPADAALSFYHFFSGWYFTEDSVALEEFIQNFYLKRGVPSSDLENASQMHHILSWYPHRQDKNLLWLHYEDLQQDLPECVRLIAEFLGIGTGDAELQQLVVHQASLEFMKQHSSKFDEHPLKHARNVPCGLPRDAGLKGTSGKVREGAVHGSKRGMPPHLVSLIEQRWKDVMTPETGFPSYDEMREAVNQELGRSFK